MIPDRAALEKRRPLFVKALKITGHMEEAKKIFLLDLWFHGTMDLAIKRIGRKRETVYYWMAKDLEFSAEVDAAREFHRDMARGAIVGMVPEAMEVFKRNLEQNEDKRMGNQNAIAVLKDQGILGGEKAVEKDERPPGVTKVTYIHNQTIIKGDNDHDD